MARLPDRVLEIARGNNRQLRRLDRETRRALSRRMEEVKERLGEELQELDPESLRAQQVRLSRLFADQASQEVTDDVEEVIATAANDAAQLAGHDVTEEINAWWSHYSREATAPNFGAIIELDRGTLMQRFQSSLDRYGSSVANRVQSEIIQTIGARGDREELTDTIQGIIDAERWRAERIARTEIQNAYNASHHATLRYAKESGMVPGMQKTCIVTWDHRTDEDSFPLEGQVRDLDENFVDGEGREYLHPPGRPNDREKEIPHVPDEEPGEENPEAAEGALEGRDDADPVEEAAQRSIIDNRRMQMSAGGGRLDDLERTRTGELTDGTYRVSPEKAKQHSFADHIEGKSFFDDDVDAEEIALEAAAQADFENVWSGRHNERAVVDLGRVVGTDVVAGRKTRYVRVVRKKNGVIHAYPVVPTSSD